MATDPEDAIRLSDLAFAWPGGVGFSITVPDFTVPKGEKLFLLGESGSGKSTLLSLVCGIAEPGSGIVEIAGQNLGKLSGPARDRFRANRIGVIFQMFNLLPYASPLENTLLPLAFAPERQVKVSDPKAEALRLLAALGLDESLVTEARSAELSIGQQQRVAAARALIGQPQLVIADEPTSALDASTQEAFLTLLMAQVDAAGATLLMVSHDARLADQFDRAIDIADIAQVKRATA